ncbi:hypothetical protein F5Y16DRAFT_357272 [Xylariaceae sp. FL0255]|nr:hypothetical protein F5Y16DRAFT_357272 [Xylariaceae sp. FL0255]
MPSKKRPSAKGPRFSLKPQASPLARNNAYTLAEEAKNTASNRRSCTKRDARLRFQPVTFISAGWMHPLKDDALFASKPPALSSSEPDVSPKAEPEVNSDSSEEVILFKGRNPAARVPSLSNIIANLDVHDPPFQSKEPDFISLRPSPVDTSPSPSPSPSPQPQDDEAAALADYIANMVDDSDDEGDGKDHITAPSPFNVLRDLGGSDSDAIPVIHSSGDDISDGLVARVPEDEDDLRLEAEDERLARILIKQEELGLGGDDVILLDGIDSDKGWLPASQTGSRRKKKKKSRMFQGGSSFPSATKMADAFDELDLMDLKQTRLQASKKGPVSFDVSDSELEDALNLALKKDRLRKAEKKKAREELRSQGLLGKNINPDDLRVKYRGGMSLDDLANEMENFMLGTNEQLILPPFDKGARQIVHQIANTFKIKSQSAGKGTGRYPVLYRTKTTLAFNADKFDIALSRVRRTWFPRSDADEKVVQTTRLLKRAEAPSSKFRGGNSSLVLREGDIVGQHAVEIGLDNKGRTMLEKMGWSKGMSLGTGETKGITVPLMHVVKKTKAGLGET